MATTPGRSRCARCGKEKATSKCGGCLQDFCYNDFGHHRQELSQQLDEVEVSRDLFRQTLTEQTDDPKQHPLIQQINKWERDSISKVRQTAEESRQLVLKHTTGYIKEIEIKLNKLTVQLRQSREENDFFETDLHHWKEELKRLTNELVKPSNITLRQDSKPFVRKIYVSSVSVLSTSIGVNARWIQNGVTAAGGNGRGHGLNQLSSLWSVYVDDDQTIYIADSSNHRIMEWKRGATSGQVVVGGNGPGDRTDQLNAPRAVIVDEESDSLIICDQFNRRVVRWPRRNGTSGQTIISNIDCSRLTMDNNGYLYVSDHEKHEVRRWRIGDTSGILVAGGNGQGNRLDQLNVPTSIFVDQEQSVYVADVDNHRVIKWMKGANEGIVVAGGQGQGDAQTQLSKPYGIVVDQMDTVYVAEYDNHRVTRWLKGATQCTIVAGGNGSGDQPNQLNRPTGLTFDRQGNLYVTDSINRRVQKFNIESSSSF